LFLQNKLTEITKQYIKRKYDHSKIYNIYSIRYKWKQLESNHELKLNVLEASGNYLLHKDLLRHLTLKNKVQFQQKLEVKFEVVVENLGNKKVLVEQEQVQIVHHYGKVVV
jgi:hypothetical protein